MTVKAPKVGCNGTDLMRVAGNLLNKGAFPFYEASAGKWKEQWYLYLPS